MSTNDKLLTISEVAKQLRVDETTVRRWINQGVMSAITLPHINKRRSYRVPASVLETLLAPAK